MGGRGSVVGNNNADLATIAMSALIDLSEGKAEESNSGKETVDKINDEEEKKENNKFNIDSLIDSLYNNEYDYADIDETVNSSTPICLWAVIKNYCSVELRRRNSTFFCVFQNTTQPPTITTMVSRLPLL